MLEGFVVLWYELYMRKLKWNEKRWARSVIGSSVEVVLKDGGMLSMSYLSKGSREMESAILNSMNMRLVA